MGFWKSVEALNSYYLEMKHTLSVLHPNPGWEGLNRVNSEDSVSLISDQIVGKHCILELYGCDSGRLNDEAFIRTILTAAAKIAGAKLLNMITHRFEPQGVTGLALLAESHLSIHTWPESRYAAIDVFTCGTQTKPDKACELLIKDFFAENYSLKSFSRETSVKVKLARRDP